MEEFDDAIRNVAHQIANLPPEPKLAAFIGLFLTDQMAQLCRLRAEARMTSDG